ncbi:HD domain-containing protein [Romboutsia sedimentorum]|uniref:HD domain-containing protein n=1 Tax=Romboutsia sedimentorum TaxID=1368474 RepID=A0ABT7EFA7_9FIRM|nr:HD domain-containing protein [Romboutsia sedimentorum]MDK2564591.1 HD domain-containing protein [Romboutsia sedimentorum]MDK2586480.1 HD domain-containing protein [Romboutsia sedimentorum]
MRDKAVELVNKYLESEHLIKHSYAVEAVMRALANKLEPDKVDEWAITGLLHDLDSDMLDYKNNIEDCKVHGFKSVEILKNEKLGNECMYQAIKAHNEDYNGVKRETLMDKAIYAADPITGFITAITLVYPDKKIASVKVKSIIKRMKELRFAAGANRDAMRSIEEVGIPFDEFAQISLDAMKEISDTLGL